MKASDVMVRNVITIGPDDDVAHAARMLTEHDISALPVVDEHRRILGILSEADLLRREELGTEKLRPAWLEAVMPPSRLAADYSRSHGRKVRELMSETVFTAQSDAPLSEIAALFERKRIKRIPIVEDGKLIGVVSRANLIQALASATERTIQGSAGASARQSMSGALPGAAGSAAGVELHARLDAAARGRGDHARCR
jgi:CBS domain-containing protein